MKNCKPIAWGPATKKALYFRAKNRAAGPKAPALAPRLAPLPFWPAGDRRPFGRPEAGAHFGRPETGAHFAGRRPAPILPAGGRRPGRPAEGRRPENGGAPRSAPGAERENPKPAPPAPKPRAQSGLTAGLGELARALSVFLGVFSGVCRKNIRDAF